MTDQQTPSPETERPLTPAEIPSTPEAPAFEREIPAEKPREQAPAPVPEAEKPAPAPPAPPSMGGEPGRVPPPKDETARRIENILEENMMGLYMIMPPEVQKVFKAKGEETVARIRALLGQARVKAKDILKLIKDWLRLIPGVNRFFLEQEAKIKTDKIMNLKRE